MRRVAIERGWAAIPVLVAGATLAVYLPATGHPFVNLDDVDYVLRNPNVAAGLTLGGVRWAFTAVHLANWHPLTWLSHMADVTLFGLRPGGHHLTSILLHAANAALLFALLRRATHAAWRSACVALLFALHPLHVESVAWVAERKDVLCAFFFLLALLAYLGYARAGGRLRYLGVVLFSALALLSKSMAVTLPFVMLLLDFWPLDRARLGVSAAGETPGNGAPLRRLLLEKAPLLLLSAASCAVTYHAQASDRSTASLLALPLDVRVANAAVSYVAYLRDTLWPQSLAVFYPHPWLTESPIPAWQTGAAFLALAAATFLALRAARRRPFLAAGWLWYLGTLLPVIGLVQIGGQARADRYTYLPLVGIFIMLAWGVPELAKGRRFGRSLVAVSAALSIAALAWSARVQLSEWRSSVALFRHAIATTRNNWLMHADLGWALLQTDERRVTADEAEYHFRETLRTRPDWAPAHKGLGLVLAKRGEVDAAAREFEAALRTSPADAWARSNLGYARLLQGRIDEAVAELREAVRLDPQYATARENLEMALAAKTKAGPSPRSQSGQPLKCR